MAQILSFSVVQRTVPLQKYYNDTIASPQFRYSPKKISSQKRVA